MLFLFLCFRPVNLLTSQIPSIVRALHKQLREKSVKTRQVNTVCMNDETPEYLEGLFKPFSMDYMDSEICPIPVQIFLKHSLCYNLAPVE